MNYQYKSQVIYDYSLINANYFHSQIQGVHKKPLQLYFPTKFKC